MPPVRSCTDCWTGWWWFRIFLVIFLSSHRCGRIAQILMPPNFRAAQNRNVLFVWFVFLWQLSEAPASNRLWLRKMKCTKESSLDDGRFARSKEAVPMKPSKEVMFILRKCIPLTHYYGSHASSIQLSISVLEHKKAYLPTSAEKVRSAAHIFFFFLGVKRTPTASDSKLKHKAHIHAEPKSVGHRARLDNCISCRFIRFY